MHYNSWSSNAKSKPCHIKSSNYTCKQVYALSGILRWIHGFKFISLPAISWQMKCWEAGMRSDWAGSPAQEFHLLHVRCHLLAKALLHLQPTASIFSETAYNNSIWPTYFWNKYKKGKVLLLLFNQLKIWVFKISAGDDINVSFLVLILYCSETRG